MPGEKVNIEKKRLQEKMKVSALQAVEATDFYCTTV